MSKNQRRRHIANLSDNEITYKIINAKLVNIETGEVLVDLDPEYFSDYDKTNCDSETRRD